MPKFKSRDQQKTTKIPLAKIDLKNAKSKKIFDDELQFLRSFKSIIIKICTKIDFDSRPILTAFEIMMNHFVPVNNEIHQFPSDIELKNVISKYSSNENCYINLDKFISMLQVGIYAKQKYANFFLFWRFS